jgi:hypothetical protein
MAEAVLNVRIMLEVTFDGVIGVAKFSQAGLSSAAPADNSSVGAQEKICRAPYKG